MTGIAACCARAVGNQTATDPVITFRKSRRRITAPRLRSTPMRTDYSRDLGLVKWGSGVSLHGSNLEPLMSALGHKQTFHDAWPMSALPPKADIAEAGLHVR
jgi:hypothetical protein